MTFNIINRRIHLYLGLALLPWVLMYGLSSLIISHGPQINPLFNDGTPIWKKQFEREYNRPIPQDADLRKVATEILEEFGLRASFFVSHPRPDRINIIVRDLRSATRLTYFIEEERLLAEKQRFRLNNFLVGLHLRGGYQQDLFLDDLWAVILDLVCMSFVIWVVSGIYLWWQIRETRFWGVTALAGGFISFGFLLFVL